MTLADLGWVRWRGGSYGGGGECWGGVHEATTAVVVATAAAGAQPPQAPQQGAACHHRESLDGDIIDSCISPTSLPLITRSSRSTPSGFLSLQHHCTFNFTV